MTESAFTTPRSDSIAIPVLVLAVLTFALNANALTAFFVGDDFDFLRGMEGFDSLADTAAFSFWGEWEPVWWASWYVDFAIWGATPLGFHLTNVFWYVVCVVCLFGLVRSVWPGIPMAAWGAALLFATHPVHDEAVTYLAARGHPMATGLGLGALWAYARARVERNSTARRRNLWGIALVAVFLAGLAKETALVLPVWAGALECAIASGPALQRLRSGMTTMVLFALPALATLGLRGVVVGLESDKLTGSFTDPAGLAAAWISDLPAYVLLAALPLPFGLVTKATLTSWTWLGWLAVLFAGVGWIVAGLRNKGRRRWDSTGLQLWGVGLVMFVTGLGPVLWADLGLRRRYVFLPSVGAVLVASAVLVYLHARSPRVVRAVLGVIVLLGAVTTWQRNATYVNSGALAEHVLTTLKGAPLDEPAPPGLEEAALLTLPRAYGGDGLSGAYLFHHTDLRSGLRYYNAPQRKIHYALKCYHAEDYQAEARFEGRYELTMAVSFRERRSFEDAAARAAGEDRFGDLLYAELESTDRNALTLHYRVYLRPGFWERSSLHIYSSGSLTPLSPPHADAGAVDLSEF